MAHILIVDDELSMREFLKIFLENEGHTVRTAAVPDTAFSMLSHHPVDLLISDIKMPQGGGLELLARVKASYPTLPVILITAYASPDDAVLAMKHGAFDYITKPFNVDEMSAIINSALSSSRNRNEETEEGCSDSDGGIIGRSAEMKKIFDIIRRVAPTRANVLIYGESGTGKELIARHLHCRSDISLRPFIPITCSALPENLLESELFGHVKGAFTGAISSKPGLFEVADGGSVFLDEIGEISPLMQTKLLRVLQEREIKRVGGTDTISVDVRIIAATNRSLEDEVLAGRFREDLFYRLSVVPIRVPPLRHRKDDIPLLVEHFLLKYADTLDKPPTGISSYGMKVLMDYDFPGNVRELENIIERAIALSESTIILPESLTLSDMRRKKETAAQQAFFALENDDELFQEGIDAVLSRLEKKCLTHALQKAHFSKTRAAKLLRTSFRSFRYRLKKHTLQ